MLSRRGSPAHALTVAVRAAGGIFLFMARKTTPGTGASQRQLRVGELIRHALAEILQRGEVHDPDLEGVVVTVPEVRMTPDLQLATVYVMPLGGVRADAVVAAFERNKRYLRGEIAHRVNLRLAPDLRFRLDTSFEEGGHIDALLKSPEVRRDLEDD
jgi:ribosome-binding factor A